MLGLKLMCLALVCHQIYASEVASVQPDNFETKWLAQNFVNGKFDPFPVVNSNGEFVYVSIANDSSKLVWLDYESTSHASCSVPVDVKVNEQVALDHSVVSFNNGQNVAVLVTNGQQHKLVVLDLANCAEQQHVVDLDSGNQQWNSVFLGSASMDGNSVDVLFVMNNMVEQVLGYNVNGEVVKTVNNVAVPALNLQNLHAGFEGYYNVVPVNGTVIQHFNNEYQLVKSFNLHQESMQLADHCGMGLLHTVCLYKTVGDNETALSCFVVDKELTGVTSQFELTGWSNNVDKVAVMNIPSMGVMISWKNNDVKTWVESSHSWQYQQSLWVQFVDKQGNVGKAIQFPEQINEEVVLLKNQALNNQWYCVNALTSSSVFTGCVFPKNVETTTQHA